MPTIYEAAGAAMRSKATRAKLRQVADRIASSARALAAAEGVDMEISRQSGTRPLGRPYERVTATSSSEMGTRTTPRRRILGRAASAAGRTGRRR